jgi:hypothetical protein
VFVTLPPTRITVTANVEGTNHLMLLDTGATNSIVRQSVFDGIAADGRKVLDEQASTVMGAQSVKLMRAKSIKAGDADVQGSILGSLDNMVFDELGVEVGQTVDGLLGGAWLREFVVSVDYAGDQLTLRRYPDRAHIHDELIRLGFALTQSGGQYNVGMVFAGSDAEAKGLTASTHVVSIDGQTLAGLIPSQADALLLGTAGTTKSVQTATSTLTIKVEDLLAP